MVRPRIRSIRRIVERTLDELPDFVKTALERCGASIEILDDPPDDVEPGTFGTMSGGTIYEFDSPLPLMPDPPRIELYVSSFAEFADDPETFEDEVRRTVLHEVGHFVGLEEEDLEEI